MAKRTDPSDRLQNPVPAGRGGNCPVCATPAAEGYWPFCSKRCADVDLARWLGGTYAIPVAADDDEDGEETADSGPAKSRESLE
jgi:endogenous inhibitor of DNA gyrase (YacG/DUF329 family)